MSDRGIPIVEVDYSKPAVISAIKVKVHSVNLFTSVSLMVQLLDSASKIIDVKQIILSGNDYLAWGNDDSYLITTALAKLGYIAVPVV